jgi:hypothetical protein
MINDNLYWLVYWLGVFNWFVGIIIEEKIMSISGICIIFANGLGYMAGRLEEKKK